MVTITNWSIISYYLNKLILILSILYIGLVTCGAQLTTSHIVLLCWMIILYNITNQILIHSVQATEEVDGEEGDEEDDSQ